MNHKQWIAWQMSINGFMSCMFSWPGFKTDYMSIDLMHCGDLGVVLYTIGSAIWERFHIMRGLMTRPMETLTDILRYIRVATKNIAEKRPPINTLTIGMLSGSKGKQARPRIKLKAAEARHTLACVSWLLQNLWAPTSPYEQLVMQCVRALNGFYENINLWHDGDMAAKSECIKCGNRFLQLYGELAAANTDTLLWKWFPKFHMFQHLLESQIAVAGNPKSSWCYFDEHNIGIAAKLAASCHPSTLHRLVLTKARL